MRLTLYLPHHSPVHDLHPVAKVAGLVALLIAAFFTETPARGLSLWVAIGALILLGKAHANLYRLRWLLALVFFMTWLVWALFLRTETAGWELGPLHPSLGSVSLGLAMAMRIAGFFALGILFLSTTRIEEFAFALRRVGVPSKVAFTFTLAFRLVPLFLDAAFTTLDAQRCRGLEITQGRWYQRARRYAVVIVPIFVGALRRADAMAMALEARGFQRRGTRTSYLRYRWRRKDTLCTLAAMGFTVVWILW